MMIYGCSIFKTNFNCCLLNAFVQFHFAEKNHARTYLVLIFFQRKYLFFCLWPENLFTFRFCLHVHCVRESVFLGSLIQLTADRNVYKLSSGIEVVLRDSIYNLDYLIIVRRQCLHCKHQHCVREFFECFWPNEVKFRLRRLQFHSYSYWYRHVIYQHFHFFRRHCFQLTDKICVEKMKCQTKGKSVKISSMPRVMWLIVITTMWFWCVLFRVQLIKISIFNKQTRKETCKFVHISLGNVDWQHLTSQLMWIQVHRILLPLLLLLLLLLLFPIWIDAN